MMTVTSFRLCHGRLMQTFGVDSLGSNRRLKESIFRSTHSTPCRFFITTVVTSWLDGRHVVFGKGEGLWLS